MAWIGRRQSLIKIDVSLIRSRQRRLDMLTSTDWLLNMLVKQDWEA